jgi:hypothetical protein
MTNRIKILQFLNDHSHDWFDDDELSDLTKVQPRQQIYQICSRLHKEDLIDRMKINGKLKNRGRAGRAPQPFPSQPVMAERVTRIPTRTSTIETWDEATFQNGLFQALQQKIGQHEAPLPAGSQRFELSRHYGQGWAEMEGELQLGRVTGTHKADILITNGSKSIAIEIKKFGSAVTDVFKARAFDAYHTKESLGNNLRNVLVYFYLKGQPSTLSIERARELSHWQDSFIGIDVERDKLWQEPVRTIESILANWNGGPEVNR